MYMALTRALISPLGLDLRHGESEVVDLTDDCPVDPDQPFQRHGSVVLISAERPTQPRHGADSVRVRVQGCL